MRTRTPWIMALAMLAAGCLPADQVAPFDDGWLSVTVDYPVLAIVEYPEGDERCGQSRTELECDTRKSKAMKAGSKTRVAMLEKGKYYLRLSCWGYREKDTARVPKDGGGSAIGLG